MQLRLILRDGTLLQYVTPVPITATKLLFELLYYGNNDMANNFQMIRYSGPDSITLNLTDKMIIGLYLKNTELFLYRNKHDCDSNQRKLTYTDNNYILDNTLYYYVSGNNIIKRQCIATDIQGNRCNASCNGNNICCIEHLRNNLTLNDIKMNHVEIKRELYYEYFKSKIFIDTFIDYLIEANLDNPIKLFTITPNILKTWIFNNPYIIKNPIEYHSDPHAFLHTICNIIHICIYSMAYTIIHSNDFIPLLCDRPCIKEIAPDVNVNAINQKYINCKVCNTQFIKDDSTYKTSDNKFVCTKTCFDKYINNDVECNICMGACKRSEMIVCNCETSHYFCHECIIMYIKSKHNDGLKFNQCPMNTSMIDNNIDLRPVYLSLDTDMIKNIGTNTKIELYSKAAVRNINFYVCPFCKVYGVDISNNIDTLNYTTKIQHDGHSIITLKWINGYMYPFVTKHSNNMIGVNDMLVSINDIDIGGFVKDKVMRMLVNNCVIETRHEQICDILTLIDKPNDVKSKNKISTIYCQECNMEWCINCNRKAHNSTCDTIENHEDIPKRVAEIVTDIMIDKCPHCTNAYVKTEGCNLIHCGNCATAFCHVCKLIIHMKNARQYWHFVGSGSTIASAICPLYDRPNSDDLKMAKMSTHIKIVNLIKNNKQYEDIIINELMKYNIIRPQIGNKSRVKNNRLRRFIRFFNSIFAKRN